MLWLKVILSCHHYRHHMSYVGKPILKFGFTYTSGNMKQSSLTGSDRFCYNGSVGKKLTLKSFMFGGCCYLLIPKWDKAKDPGCCLGHFWWDYWYSCYIINIFNYHSCPRGLVNWIAYPDQASCASCSFSNWWYP